MKPLDLAEQIIIKREGFRDRAYLDSLEILTGGYGHKLTALDGVWTVGDFIDRELGEQWLLKDLGRAYEEATVQAAALQKTSADFIAYLTSANYQLGDFEADFRATYQLLKDGNWQAAIGHLQNSLWAKQTPIRVSDLVDAIRRAYAPTLWGKLKTLITGV